MKFQESVFGEDQTFTDMNDPPNLSDDRSTNSASTVAADGSSISEDDPSKKEFDPRLYRPLDVIISITMHDIQAHLIKVRFAPSRETDHLSKLTHDCSHLLVDLIGNSIRSLLAPLISLTKLPSLFALLVEMIKSNSH